MKPSGKVYKQMRRIPKGKVTTYKILGLKAGVNSAQAIGQICKRNPDAPATPCHRVVSSDGSIGGFGGHTKGAKITEKINLLKKEGITVKDGKVVNFEEVLWS